MSKINYQFQFVPSPIFIFGEPTTGRTRIKENGRTKTVLIEDKLDMYDVAVLGAIAFFNMQSDKEAEKKGAKPKGCYASNATISEICCGVCKQTIKNSLFKLENAKYIQTVNPNSKKRRIYLTEKSKGRTFTYGKKGIKDIVVPDLAPVECTSEVEPEKVHKKKGNKNLLYGV